MLVSTKNVFAPGASFGAYSATKAASHQLARIASLELAEIDVRVNMVAPDAVFSRRRAQVGAVGGGRPGRMQARGLDEAGLEEYYRNRNLLKARVTARSRRATPCSSSPPARRRRRARRCPSTAACRTRRRGRSRGFLDCLGKETYSSPMRRIISSKGRITIPAELRKKLGLTPGTAVEFELGAGEVLLRKRVKGAHPVDQVFGLLSLRKPVDRLVDDMRGPARSPTS